MKALTKLVLSMVLCTPAFNFAASTQPIDTPFDIAFKAIKYPLDPRKAASIEHSAELYRDLVSRFPKDPHVWKAKLAVANVYSCALRREIRAKADPLFAELQPLADPASADGRLICDRIIAHDLFDADKWHPERLTGASQLADRYEAWAMQQDSRAPLLHVWAAKGAILTSVGPDREAISYLLSALKKTESWTDYFAAIGKTRPAEYNSVIAARQEVINSLAEAVGGSDNPDVEDQVAKAGLIGFYPTLRAGIDRWRSRRGLPVVDDGRRDSF